MDLLKRAELWQTCGYFHPFTCRNEECRKFHNQEALITKINDNKVWFKCPYCGYGQEVLEDDVPSLDYLNEHIAIMKELFK